MYETTLSIYIYWSHSSATNCRW